MLCNTYSDRSGDVFEYSFRLLFTFVVTSSGGIVQTIAVVVLITLQRQRLRGNRVGSRHIQDVV